MNREPGAKSTRPRPTPIKAHALRTTTLANTWQVPPVHAQLTQRFGHPLSAWRIPQAIPATTQAAQPVHRFTTEHQ